LHHIPSATFYGIIHQATEIFFGKKLNLGTSDIVCSSGSQPFLTHGPLCNPDTSWTVVRNLLYSKVTIFKNVLSKIYGTLYGPLEILDGPPVVHFENHWFTVTVDVCKKERALKSTNGVAWASICCCVSAKSQICWHQVCYLSIVKIVLRRFACTLLFSICLSPVPRFAQVREVITRQPIELESCSNPLEMRKVLYIRSKYVWKVLFFCR